MRSSINRFIGHLLVVPAGLFRRRTSLLSTASLVQSVAWPPSAAGPRTATATAPVLAIHAGDLAHDPFIETQTRGGNPRRSAAGQEFRDLFEQFGINLPDHFLFAASSHA
jgi:hypothetical protein